MRACIVGTNPRKPACQILPQDAYAHSTARSHSPQPNNGPLENIFSTTARVCVRYLSERPPGLPRCVLFSSARSRPVMGGRTSLNLDASWEPQSAPQLCVVRSLPNRFPDSLQEPIRSEATLRKDLRRPVHSRTSSVRHQDRYRSTLSNPHCDSAPPVITRMQCATSMHALRPSFDGLGCHCLAAPPRASRPFY